MKTLLLMRHGKSSWKDSSMEDHDRPLSKRGLKDAPQMAQLIVDKELIPQKVLSSTARRAHHTAEILAEITHTSDIIYLNSFYLAEPAEYLQVLKDLPDDLERVMVIGHNPGLEGLLQILSGEVESLPTSAIAHLVLPIRHWTEITDHTEGELVAVWRPREIKEKHKK